MFKLNNVYHGFKLTEERKVNEIDSLARVFEHVKSGARLLHLENRDDNKVFSIAFRTTPHDSTGVPHIIEHTVLCGSKKFRTKDVFTDMAKSSLKTFINAMTYPDKTVYPVSSRNQKDFFNLMEVYLDAVFYPNIYENHELLRQEGWRYEVDEETGKLIYKGIVYSEMKGALSSPEGLLDRSVLGSLFPNTTYDVNSGGDPMYIPDLTQEAFENFHRNFYHPSNSYIYLYGDQDLDACLKLINEDYLNNFERINVNSQIEDTKEFEEMAVKIEEYPISEDEDESNKTFMALNFACDESKNGEAYLAMDIVKKMLVESDASPIKKALLAEGLNPQDNWDLGYVKNTMFSLAINSTNVEEKGKFTNIVFDVLKDIVTKGLDRKIIEAAINSLEFKLREADPWQMANKGMTYSLSALESWIYDGDPLTHLNYEGNLNKIKIEVENNYFEKFIEEKLINNKHCSLVILKPKKGLGEERAKEVEKRLEQYKATLTEADIVALKERNKSLKENQMKENTPEQIATLPKISLKEVSREVEMISQKVIEKDGVKLLSHNLNTNKVAYISLLFDANTIEEKYIPYLALLRDMLGKVDTVNKSYGDLNIDILRKTGGIDFDTVVYSDIKTLERYYSKFIIKSKVVSDNVKDLFDLINEIIVLTKFDNINRIKEVVQEIKSALRRYVINAGQRLGMARAASYYSKANKYTDMLKGVEYYKFICDIEKNFEEKATEIQESLKMVYKTIFNKNNLIVSYTGEETYIDNITSNLNSVLNGLNEDKLEIKDISFNPSKDIESVITQSNVQYVVKSFNFNKFGIDYSGKMRVLQNILDSEYLYTRVRLQGGAYGCYMALNNDGTIDLYSYRDPNLVETIKTYNEADIFIKDINYSVDDMEKFIIGAVGQLDRPLSPQGKGDRAVRNYICGISNEDMQREKDELLSTTLEDVKAFADMIKKGMEENYCCVVGNEIKINENKEIFDKITVLL